AVLCWRQPRFARRGGRVCGPHLRRGQGTAAVRGAPAARPRPARQRAAGAAMSRLRAAWPPRGWLVLLAGAVWLGWLAWARPLTLPDEGRYAGVAWEMLRSGSHAVPLLDGMPYFHQPPLYYWMAEWSFRWFGLNEWAARLPSWLAAWGALAGVYGFVRRYRDAAAATMAAVVLATMPFYYGGAQVANTDMLVAGPVSLCVLAGADAVLRAQAGRPHRAMSLAAAGLAALAVLAKGLIGLVLPGAILCLWLLLTRRWRGYAVLLWPPALAVFALVAVPWFWLMQQRFRSEERRVGEEFKGGWVPYAYRYISRQNRLLSKHRRE